MGMKGEGGVVLPEGMDSRVKDALDMWGIRSLYPPQRDSFPAIAEGKNLVVCVPTAAGKSLIAYCAIVNRVVKKGKKALYIVPLRALASEKFEELKQLNRLGIKVALSYGDFDDDDRYLERFDVVVATSEKADSLLRHRTKWLSDLSVIVADEVHLLNDKRRGPTLEVILTRFKQLNPKAQMICLSATVKNSADIAGWLGAELIESDFRPVKLSEGVLYGGTVRTSDGKESTIVADTGDPVTDAVLDVVLHSDDGRGQALVFVYTRRNAEAAAVNMSKVLGSRLSEADIARLREISDRLGGDSRINKRLKQAVSGGAAFHHAGLSNEHRKLIEAAFKERRIKVLFATPTLAAGINLPARRVIVRDWKRFEQFNPQAPIPVLEVKQMFGRAGRPRFDTEGQSYIYARSEEEVDLLMERYIWGEVEEVYSKLGSFPALRMHILSSFATNYVRDMDELWEFIRSTFFAYQNDTWKITTDVEDVISFLEEEEFIKVDGDNVEATDFGKRVARLYIDPLSAVVLRKALLSEPKKLTPFSILQAVCYTPDIHKMFVRRKEYEKILEEIYSREDELLMEVPTEKADYDFFLASVKSAIFLLEWIGEGELGMEANEERLEKLFNVGPGDIRSKVDTAKWILYSMRELARLFNSPMAKDIDLVALRVEHGIKKELLELIGIKGVGRVRARRLFDAGIKGSDDVRSSTVQRLSSVHGIGRVLALAIKNEVLGPEGEILEEDEPGEEGVGSGQSRLGDFS